MINTKTSLSRRTVLRGMGATIALPLLDAMVPSFTALANTVAAPAVRRLGFMYLPNGVSMNKVVNYWKPKTEGVNFEFSPILSPLEPFRDNVIVVSGLTHPQAQPLGDGNGDHTRATATWLNGAHPKKTEGADLRAGTTADQIAAAKFGKDTALPSLELVASDLDELVGNCENSYSCAYLNTLAWRTPTTPLPMENNPRAAFERLFGDGGTAAERVGRLRENRSILDWAKQDMVRLQQTVGPSDRIRVSEYLEAVREVERRIQKAEELNSKSTLPAVLERPVGIPERFDDHCQLLFDLLWLAYQSDITRVFTFMLGKEINTRTYPEAGIPEGHHALSHHGNKPEQMRQYAKLNTYQATQFAYFLEKLRSTPDGDGTLLDHTMLLYGAGFGNGHLHSHEDLALVLAGGGFKGGRHLAFAPDGGFGHPDDWVPMTNLLVTMLDKVGIPLERFGDSNGWVDLETGRMKPEPLSLSGV